MRSSLVGRRLSLFSLFSLVVGCQTSGSRSAVKDANDLPISSLPPPLSACPQGAEVSRWIMVGEASDPGPLVNIPKYPAGGTPDVVIPDGNGTIALDVCLAADETATLQKVFQLNFGVYTEIDVPVGSVVRGLKEVLFEQAYAGFEVRIPFVNRKAFFDNELQPSNEGILILGQSAGLAAALLTKKVGDQVFASPISGVLVGTFKIGDFIGNPCPGGAEALAEFTLGTAHFKASGCQFTGTSGGVSPVMHAFVVTDTSPELPAAIRGQPIAVEVKENEGIYKTVHTHHIVCEGFSLKLPHATYGATATGGSAVPDGFQGCDKDQGPVEDAPGRGDFGGQGVVYAITYANGAKKSGVTDPACWHYFFPCD